MFVHKKSSLCTHVSVLSSLSMCLLTYQSGHAIVKKYTFYDPRGCDGLRRGETQLRDIVWKLPARRLPTDVAVAASEWAPPLGRARGPDGRAREDLRLWPGRLTLALADLLRAVEAIGRWRVGLQAADVALLPKPGGQC